MRPQKRCAPYGEIAERGPGRTGGNLGHRPPRGRSIARWYKAARGFGRHRFTIRASFLQGVERGCEAASAIRLSRAGMERRVLSPARGERSGQSPCVRGGGMAKPCRWGCVRLSELGGLDPCQRPRQPGRRVRIGGFFRCLRRGTFHRGKVPKTRRGLRPPVPRGAARRASPEKAFPRPLRSTGLSRPILPAPSRLRAGQWNRTIVTATGFFSKAARTAQERGRIKHTAVSCAFYPFSP